MDSCTLVASAPVPPPQRTSRLSRLTAPRPPKHPARLRKAHTPGDDHLILNHGLAAVVLILMLAFTLCAAFTQCHSKLVRRYHLPGIEVARQMRVSVSKLPPRIRAPDSPTPQ